MSRQWAALGALLLGAAAVAVVVPHAEADDDAPLLSGEAYLRAVSLDLRGAPPTLEEYGMLDEDGDIPEDLLAEWLASDAFAERAVRHHRSLFWNNLEQVRLTSTGWYLYDDENGVYYVRNRAERYGRGYYGTCGDFAASLDANGEPVPVTGDDGLVQEGYVWVSPYWDPDNPIPVCAYDAQDAQVSPNGSRCDSDEGDDDPYCGCGPELSWCFPSYSTGDEVLTAMAADLDHRVRAMVAEDRPYLDLLTDNRAWVNGPMVHWLRHSRHISGGGVNLDLAPYPTEDQLPDLTYRDTETWVELELGPEQAGIFTSPAFLLRFQTNRGRANRFYNDFLCQTFTTPEGGIELGEDAVMTLDLTAREGCNHCHALLEPAAASWGRWVEGGVGYLDPVEYPDHSEVCLTDVQSSQSLARDCSRYYVTAPVSAEEVPYAGWLLAFRYLEPRHTHHIAQGPRLLVEQGIADGRLPRCVSARAAESLLGRALADEDEALLAELSDTLEGSGWSYRSLAHAIVTSSSYRRLP